MSAGHGSQILLSDSTAAIVDGRLPDGARLRDLGEHRLKDLGRPARLFQLGHPGLPAEFPPLSTLDNRPNNLPTETSAFVGRDAELEALRERLDDVNVRLLTLTGPGGTGKTRLAIRAAADQVDRFTDGVYFVDLITATDSEAVLALMVTAVGIADTAELSPLDALRRRLRGQQVLLVLDNFEQVTVAAPTLVALLAECPGLKILVTSRQALRVRGENVVSVPPLSLPGAAAGAMSADQVSQFEAIQLFVERARGVRSDFRLTDDNAAAVADICRRLDGLPLAIELATARLNLFSPEALRDRLAGSLKALGSGARDLPARQQTLMATIEWSYQLLSPSEQRLFEILSVCAGCSVEAVEAVAAGLDDATGEELDALEGLSSLLDKSLIRQVEATDGDPMRRVVMLETIKAYATKRLDAQPELAAAARESHARYFAALAHEAEDETLAAELDNLRIAWRHSVAAQDVERLNVLRDALWPMLEARGLYRATIEFIDDVLGVVAASPDSPDRWQKELTLKTKRARAMMLLHGYSAEVEGAYAEALALVQEHGEVPQVFPILRSLGSFHALRGEFDKGIRYANEILRLAGAEGDGSMIVDGYSMLGADTGFSGQLETGLGYLDQAIAAFEGGGYQPRRLRLGLDPRVSCLTTSGFFLWLLGYPDQAVGRADRAVALATELDHPYSLAYAFYHAGYLHLWRQEAEVVADRAASALRVAEIERPADLASARKCAAGRGDERPRPTRRGHPPDGRRPESVRGPANPAGLLADDPVHAGRGPRRRRHARTRLRADRRGPQPGRHRRRAGAAVPHRPRGSVAAGPRCGRGRRDGVVRARVRGGGERRRPDASAQGGGAAGPDGAGRGAGRSDRGATSGPRDLHGGPVDAGSRGGGRATALTAARCPARRGGSRRGRGGRACPGSRPTGSSRPGRRRPRTTSPRRPRRSGRGRRRPAGR